jgi:chromosome segregation ATPase
MTNRKNDMRKTDVQYGYYSKLLKEPFDSIEELQEAEEAYYAKQKAKEDAVAQKKADATKVEDAFKALNAARKEYKEKLTQLTKEYAEALENLKKAFELGKKDIHNTLAMAEEVYQAALKEFTDKYDSYHVSLKDGDFETTISKQTSDEVNANTILDIFGSLFNW